MVRLEITIKEINSLDYKEITEIGTEISIQEIGRKATKSEKEVSNILKKRLGYIKIADVKNLTDKLFYKE